MRTGFYSEVVIVAWWVKSCREIKRQPRDRERWRRIEAKRERDGEREKK